MYIHKPLFMYYIHCTPFNYNLTIHFWFLLRTRKFLILVILDIYSVVKDKVFKTSIIIDKNHSASCISFYLLSAKQILIYKVSEELRLTSTLTITFITITLIKIIIFIYSHRILRKLNNHKKHKIEFLSRIYFIPNQI